MMRLLACAFLALLIVTAAEALGGSRPRLPVVACPTGETPDLTGRPLKRNATWVWVHPQSLPTSVAAPTGMSANVAAGLARYEGDVRHAPEMNVLAPRGWKCSGYIPEDGNSDMTVGPSGSKPEQQIQVSYRWAGAGFA